MGRAPVAVGAALDPSSDAAASFSTTTHSDEGDDSPLPPAAALSGAAEPGSSERAATPPAEAALPLELLARSGKAAADLSVLVHEMVHHLQNIGGIRYECPAAREQLAYLAQDKWLGLFGQDLEHAFEIDKFTLKVSTSCGF